MNNVLNWTNNRCALLLILTIVYFFSSSGTTGGADIYPRPIEFSPEPVNKLHPKLQWIRTKKIRACWGSDNLYDEYGNSGKTKARVMAEAGFNVAVIGMKVAPDNRSYLPGLTYILPANISEAQKHGLALWIKWRYGSEHQEPYRRYRAPHGKLAEKTSCPLDVQYIERHVGRWALKVAERGADGFVIDTEMYLSDLSDYEGPCVCDYCFRSYLDEFARNGDAIFNSVVPEDRGTWLRNHGIYGHYSRFAAKRTEKLYDRIRKRCQAINPAFIFGYAQLPEHIPGMTRGLGTSSVPCIVFDGEEYSIGPSSLMQRNLRYLRRTSMPAMYVCGLWIAKTTPEALAKRALIASLYADGWWIWYGTALLTDPGDKEEIRNHPVYGRYKGLPNQAYWQQISQMHKKLKKLLSGPKEAWPPYPIPTEMKPPPYRTIFQKNGIVAIDGRLDDMAWKSAAHFDLVKDRYDRKKGPENTFWFCYDSAALYFAARCPIPEGTELEVVNRGHDHPYAWINDGLELFIDSLGTRRRYAHIIISALGDVYESQINFVPGSPPYGDLDWNPIVKVAATQTKVEYILEARIQFDEILRAPRPGDTWGVNVCRARPAYQTWCPTFGIFHNPSRFGFMTFM